MKFDFLKFEKQSTRVYQDFFFFFFKKQGNIEAKKVFTMKPQLYFSTTDSERRKLLFKKCKINTKKLRTRLYDNQFED